MSKNVIGMSIALVLLGGGVAGLALTQAPPKPANNGQPPAADHERTVTEKDVPKAALDTLKKLAGSNAITEFAEEVEHGHKFYEGSWKGATGNVDAVVTEAGDLVVIEEVVPNDSVPSSARAAVEKAAGAGAKLTIEKKTMILYEAHWKKDGKSHELVLTPDARPFDEDKAAGETKKENGDKDDDDDDKD